MADPQSTVTGPGLLTDRIRQLEEAEFCLDFVEQSTKYKTPFVPIWDEVQDNYMVVPFGGSPIDAISALMGLRTTGVIRKTTETVSRLKDPETHQIIETLTSEALALLLGIDDYIRALPIGIDDPEKARLISRLLMAVFDQPGMYRTHYQLFKNAYLYGTSIVEVGWEQRERDQVVQKPRFDKVTGAYQGTTLESDSVIYRDRVLMREINLRDFYPDPSGTRIHEDMNGVAKRFRTTRWKARALAAAGTYDKAATERALYLADVANQKPPARYGDQPFPGLANIMPPNAYGLTTGFEFWGEVPFKRPGGRNRVITLLNGQWVRGKPNMFLDGDIPIKEIVVNPISGRFFGLAPAEVIRFLQDAADNFLMLFTDAADLAIRGPLLMGQAFGGDAERLKSRRMNDVILCKNPDMVKPLPYEFNALTMAGTEMLRRKMTMREASGASNPLQAIGAEKAQTATETNTLLRLSTQRVSTSVTLIERDDYPWIGRTTHSRIRQFAEPVIVARLAGDIFHVKLEDIDEDADVRFVGSQQGGSPAQIVQTHTAAIDSLGAAPPGLVERFPDLFIRLFRDGMKIPDAERIVNQSIAVSRQQQQMEQEQEAQMLARKGSQKSGGMMNQRGGSPPNKPQPQAGSEEAQGA